MLGTVEKNYFYTLQVGAFPTVDLAKSKISELGIKEHDVFYQATSRDDVLGFLKILGSALDRARQSGMGVLFVGE